MGIPKLTTYVNQRKSILFKHDLDLRGSKLLFDGSALLWTLMRNVPRRIYAGDYDSFHVHVENFFGKLKANDITVYVVMDGSCNFEMKLRTIKKRCTDMIKRVGKMNNYNGAGFCDVTGLPLPLFDSFYVDAMRESNIPFITCKEYVFVFYLSRIIF